MSERAHRLLDFFAEAKRRKVYVAVVAYIAVAMVVIELGEAITAALELPAATPQVLTILLMLGFPVVVVLAWVFDITTEGVRKTEPLQQDRDARRPRRAALHATATVRPVLPEVRVPSLRARTARNDEQADVPVDPERVSRAAFSHMRHELRTPVNGIIGYSEMLLEDAADPELETELKKIRAAGGELLSRIESLLSQEAWHAAGADEDPRAYTATIRDNLREPAASVIATATELISTCRAGSRDDLIPDIERTRAAAQRLLDTSSELALTAESPGPQGDQANAALTRDVLSRILPVEPGSLAVDGEGRILVVDDSAMNRDLLLRKLARSGYIVDTATDGIEALERITAREYDLVLLDVLMPRMDGVEALRRIRSDHRLDDMPVLMLSSLDEVDSAIRCIELGAEEYLSKPFQPTLLAARIAANIALRRLRARDRTYTAEIASAADEVERLTHAAFPESVAVRLRAGETGIADTSPAATAVACTLRTPARPHDPSELINELDAMTAAIDAIAEAHGVQTVLMRPYGAVLIAGCPEPIAVHADIAAALALDLLHRMPDCGIGIHTGSVTAGVIGTRRPHYEAWGEAVETAEALSCVAPTGAAVVSPTTQGQIRGHHRLTPGAVTEVPGLGHMRFYLLRPSAVAAKA